MVELELEKTYLLQELPADILTWKSKIISDAYVPIDSQHPVLRVRLKGEKYEITKKEPVVQGDASEQQEHTIALTKEEYDTLCAIQAKRFTKKRFFGKIEGNSVEIDVYLDELRGLVVADFEFANEDAKQSFIAPKLCFADITQETGLAGGMLAGKSYGDIQSVLDTYNYKKLEHEVTE